MFKQALREQQTSMTQQPNIPARAYDDHTQLGASYMLARRISQIFHPVLMNLASFLIVGFAALASRTTGLLWAGICILAILIPPVVFYYVRLRQGAYSDEDISVREQRNELYLFSLVWAVLAIGGLVLLGVPRPFLALILAGVGLGLVNGLINLFWKISAHASSVASVATIALLYWRPMGVVLWIAAITVGWARVRTRNHTVLQVLAGFTTATLIVVVAFTLIGQYA